MSSRSFSTVGPILPTDLPQIDSLLETAAAFFASDHEPDQVPADEATFDKLLSLSMDTIGVQRDAQGRIIAWCTVFPTTPALMQAFLDRELTERALFDRTEAGDAGALYVMSVFVLPPFRAGVNPVRLVTGTMAPFMDSDPAIFYHGWSAAGARLGTLLRRKYSDAPYRVFAFDPASGAPAGDDAH